jgi:uncharacterized protein (TIGR00369 family)
MDIDPALPWRDIADSGFHSQIGPVRFARSGEATWQAALALDARHMNRGGVCHGGVLLTLADIAMGAASFAAGGERPCATIQLDSQFVAAAKEGQTLVAFARQLRAVRELSFMECEVHAGCRLVLSASGIWKYLSRGADPAAKAPPP